MADLDPREKSKTQNTMGIAGLLLLIAAFTALMLALMGCTYARSGSNVAWAWGGGNRSAYADTNCASVVNGDLPAYLNAVAPIAESAAKGAAKGLVPVP